MISELCLEDVLLKSAQSVFETMIFMDITESCDPDLKQEQPESILGSITFKGTIEGCLSILFSEEGGRQVALNMLGMDSDEEITAEEVDDAIGEVANMVMGSIKGQLDDDTYHVEVSIPTVVNGSGFEQRLSDMSNKIALEACLEERYPVRFLLQFRMASGNSESVS